MKTTLLILPLVFSLTTPSWADEPVSVSGSTTVLPLMQKITESFTKAKPDIQVEISGGGSGNGIKALMENYADIAMSSRKLKNSEIEAAAKKNIQPQEIVLAKDAIVPVVNANNPVQEISLENLRKMYTGEIKNWKELGGNDAPIVLISRDSSSGTFEGWSEMVMKKKRVTPRALLQASNGTVVQIVGTTPNAIGYIGFSYLSPSIM